MGIRHNLMRGRCNYCGRILRYANIPNRGPVMAHGTGEGMICRRLIARGRDLISRSDRDFLSKLPRAFGAHVRAYYADMVRDDPANRARLGLDR